MNDDADEIPIIETYRGVGLHEHQNADRLDVVRRAIDNVFEEDALSG